MRLSLTSMSSMSLLRPSPLATRTIGRSTSLSVQRYASSTTTTSSSEPVQVAEEEVATAVPTGDTAELRIKAIKLYKELHRLGRDYPDPNYEFNKRLRRAFEKNSKTTDPVALQKQLELGEHIKKEVLALISLKKFRHLRRSYHANEDPR